MGEHPTAAGLERWRSRERCWIETPAWTDRVNLGVLTAQLCSFSFEELWSKLPGESTSKTRSWFPHGVHGADFVLDSCCGSFTLTTASKPNVNHKSTAKENVALKTAPSQVQCIHSTRLGNDNVEHFADFSELISCCYRILLIKLRHLQVGLDSQRLNDWGLTALSAESGYIVPFDSQRVDKVDWKRWVLRWHLKSASDLQTRPEGGRAIQILWGGG